MPSLRAGAEFVSRGRVPNKCIPICGLSGQSCEPDARSLQPLLACRIRDNTRTRVRPEPPRIHSRNHRAALSRFERSSRYFNNSVYFFNRHAVEFGDLRSRHPVICQCPHPAQLRGGDGATVPPKHLLLPRRFWFGRHLYFRAWQHPRRHRQDTRLTRGLWRNGRAIGYRRQFGRHRLVHRFEQIFSRLAGSTDFFAAITVVGRFPIGHKTLLPGKIGLLTKIDIRRAEKIRKTSPCAEVSV